MPAGLENQHICMREVNSIRKGEAVIPKTEGNSRSVVFEKEQMIYTAIEVSLR